MGCIIKYKKQSIPEEQFLQYLNKQIAINNLFETNGDFASKIYEALGFNNLKSKVTLSKKFADTYNIVFNGEIIGTIDIPSDLEGDTISIGDVNIKPEFRGKGLGVETYKAAMKIAGKPLESFMATDEANRVWNSLIKQGLAKKTDTGFVTISAQITPQQKQKAQQLYSQYLDSIGVTDIAYHHSEKDISEFTSSSERYFQKELKKKNRYIPKLDDIVFLVKKPLTEEFMSKCKFIGSWGLKTPKTLQFNAGEKIGEGVHPGIDEGIFAGIEGNYDAIDFGRIRDNKTWSEVIAITNPKNAIKLGSKQDIQGFKDFVQGKQSITPRKGISELFSENPQLASIGTPEQYSQYLDTIFPDSKVKDIVYRGGKGGISEEQYYTLQRKYAERYGKVTSVILNLPNPVIADRGIHRSWASEELTDRGLIGKDYPGSTSDAIIEQMNGDIPFSAKGNFDVYVIKNENQKHTLGNKQDIENFAKFVGKEETKFDNKSNIDISLLNEDIGIKLDINTLEGAAFINAINNGDIESTNCK